MSRNFELLQKIGREQSLYTTTTAEEPFVKMIRFRKLEALPEVMPVGKRPANGRRRA